ncbi:1,2-phenylacetyl-CoA epoxidase subunit PaaD [Halalkalicoccus sp. NIPERK01]|uniref:1,2-phenylacetyl-CoA epoxidase subunit PaaD n=1 Tax=Halalkalicoccus sp. NIPERK01 TaxID=3053469 RepID=UPI00256EE49D|nr:metal-sulfur cluster assembly factor [Halalkalicoccus sp. NIPERK01]
MSSERPTACAYTDYTPGESIEEFPKTGEGSSGIERQVWDALYEVEDPEMPISVVDLGLIYGVGIEGLDGKTNAVVTMTLTYTGCPARSMLKGDIREAAASPDGIDSAEVRLVWSPEWTLEMVSEAGKEDLREFGLSI